jgi:hypothetical protein
MSRIPHLVIAVVALPLAFAVGSAGSFQHARVASVKYYDGHSREWRRVLNKRIRKCGLHQNVLVVSPTNNRESKPGAGRLRLTFFDRTAGSTRARATLHLAPHATYCFGVGYTNDFRVRFIDLSSGRWTDPYRSDDSRYAAREIDAFVRMHAR